MVMGVGLVISWCDFLKVCLINLIMIFLNLNFKIEQTQMSMRGIGHAVYYRLQTVFLYVAYWRMLSCLLHSSMHI